jgi:hypothetical protein
MSDLDRELRVQDEVFVRELDGMIESTEEFLADDTHGYEKFTEKLDVMVRGELRNRLNDLIALEHVRDLWENTFKPTYKVD